MTIELTDDFEKIFLFLQKKTVMDIQSRKIQFIQEFLKYANVNILDKFEEMLKQERKREFEKEIKPMTLKEYELRVETAFKDVKNNRVKRAKTLKDEIATWK